MNDSTFTAFDELLNLGKQYDKIAELGHEITEKYRELYCLYQITATLSEKMNLDASLRVIKKLFKETLIVDQFSIFILDEKSQDLVLRSSFGIRGTNGQPPHFGLDEGVFAEVLTSKKLLYMPKMNSAPNRYNDHPDLQKKEGAFVCVPLVTETNEPLGAIHLYRKNPESFSTTDLKLLDKISRQIALVIEKIMIYHHTKELSITDDLTGIFNRRYFNQRFEREMLRSQRYNRPLTLIMVDIDHFKRFNDTHGHLMGDKILIAVARILEDSLRKADIVARFGGEEFVVLLPEIDKIHARRVAEKLRENIESHDFSMGNMLLKPRITISLGLAAFPEDAMLGDDLIESADRALYLAKAQGRNQVVYHHKNNGNEEKPQPKFRLATAGVRA